jgi:MFS family permease
VHVGPTGEILIGARVLQGSRPRLWPTSLAIVGANFASKDRGVAVGAWAGWSGVSSAIGPFLGGWLADAGSWRWVFAVVVAVSVVAAWV